MKKVREFFAVVLCMTLFVSTTQPLMAQQAPQAQQNPLVTEQRMTNGQVTTVWQLIIPAQPEDRDVLQLNRLVYGFSLIQSGGKVTEFIKEYQARVVPPNAYMEAASLVIQYAGNRVLTDPVDTIGFGPNDVQIIRTADEIRRYYDLNPGSFSPVLWQRDPIGDCVIVQRRDLLKNADAIEARIQKIFASEPNKAQAWIRAFRSCANQNGDSPTCRDVRVADFPFLQRNHGRNSVGENERYDPRTTNRPDAHMTIYWVPELNTWKGNGWECCGNPLEFFVSLRLTANVITKLVQTPQFDCMVMLDKNVLSSRADVATARLTLTPPQNPDDVLVDWFLNGLPLGRNQMMVDVSGAAVTQLDTDQTVLAVVAVGDKEVRCSGPIRLHLDVQLVPITYRCTITLDKRKLVDRDDVANARLTITPTPKETPRVDWHLRKMPIGKDTMTVQIKGRQLGAPDTDHDVLASATVEGRVVECLETVSFTQPPGGNGKKIGIAAGIGAAIVAAVFATRGKDSRPVPTGNPIKTDPEVIRR